MKISAPCAADLGAVGELAGQAELARRRSGGRSPFPSCGAALLGALDGPVEQLVRPGWARRSSQWSKASRSAVSTMRVASARAQPVLGLADEFGLAHEHREHRRALHQHVFGGQAGGALVALELGIGAQAAEQGGAQPLFVRAALGGRNGVAVGLEEAVGEVPADRPFDRAVRARLAGLAREDVVDDALLALDARREEIAQAAGEVEARLVGNFVVGEALDRSSSGSRRRRTDSALARVI